MSTVQKEPKITEFVAKLAKADPLFDLFARRRSVRRYELKPVPHQALTYIQKVIDKAKELFDAPFVEVLIHRIDSQDDAVLRAATRGFIGKLINPWLTRHPPSVLMILTVKSHQLRYEMITQAAAVFELAILAATEVGLATCWMAGIEPKQLKKELNLGSGYHVLAASPVGFAGSRTPLSWDSVVGKTISGKRFPIQAFFSVGELVNE